ncbi:hypothetical protein J6590_051295 [Homalodisca vitripennis]|nr:hypothetical protein J6590_051295 [Homalodisca vitripennis]
MKQPSDEYTTRFDSSVTVKANHKLIANSSGKCNRLIAPYITAGRFPVLVMETHGSRADTDFRSNTAARQQGVIIILRVPTKHADTNMLVLINHKQGFAIGVVQETEGMLKIQNPGVERRAVSQRQFSLDARVNTGVLLDL